MSVDVLQDIAAEDDILNVAFGTDILISPLINDRFSAPVILEVVRPPENGEVSIEDTELVYNPEQRLVGEDQIIYMICYEDCPDLCDEAVISLTVGLEVDCFVSNLVTPNGDGYNDVLAIPCLDSGRFESNSLLILNEWGDEVFSAAPYENDWTGTYNGSMLPVGTYFYIFDPGDGSLPLQGFLILEL